MVPLLSLSLTQREQLGEILGGEEIPGARANRGFTCPPSPGEVVSNTGKSKSQITIGLSMQIHMDSPFEGVLE